MRHGHRADGMMHQLTGIFEILSREMDETRSNHPIIRSPNSSSFGSPSMITRTYLKIVDSLMRGTYKAARASIARRPMGTDSGLCSRGTHPGQSSGPQAGARPRDLGSRALDFEHRRAVAPAAAGRSQ